MPVITADQVVSLHTAKGVQLYQFLPDQYSQLNWARESRDISLCDLVIPPSAEFDRFPDIFEWVHWITVFDDQDLTLWTGPIQSIRGNRRRGLQIRAKDHATYLSRTRVPMTKKWDAADPAWPAGELWERMLDQKGIAARPIVRADPEGDRYDFETKIDEQELDQTIGDLVQQGLYWTVVAGVPILGPLSRTPVMTLNEDDFIGDGIDIVRDGTAVINDVLVRGKDNFARAQVAYHGQSLQAIKNLDDMSGVSNVTRAAARYVQYNGVARTRLELPSSTVLAPDAPVTINELMPSMRFVIEAQGILQLVELTTVEVERRSGAVDVKVTMESALTLAEKEDLELDMIKDAPKTSLGAAAAR